MASNAKVREYVEKLYACRSNPLYNDLDAVHRGTGLVLSALEQSEGSLYAGELASKLSVSTARIAALLKKMEQNGLIVRRSSAEDGRRTVVIITTEGSAALESMRRRAYDGVELLLQEIGQDDLDTFIRISRRINEVLGV